MARSGYFSNRSSGGMMGSGVHGGLGAVILCKSDDMSYYCMFAKLLSSIIMFFLFALILGTAYRVIMPLITKKSRR